ncbi:hypothetical protein D0S45_20480 [Marinifilum sp. JC120]|nr:hypothetical protein D0S45_20480 [Marinifilum sp. JC120]
MMKLIRAGLMSAVMVVLMCSGVFAQGTFIPQGSAVVPGVESAYFKPSERWISTLQITNLTNEEIDCKVTIYNYDGSDVTHKGEVCRGSSSSSAVIISTGTGLFSIPAHGTRFYRLRATNYKEIINGHAVVQWSSTDPKIHKALMGTMRIEGIVDTTTIMSHITINNGQPF